MTENTATNISYGYVDALCDAVRIVRDGGPQTYGSAILFKHAVNLIKNDIHTVERLGKLGLSNKEINYILNDFSVILTEIGVD